MLLYFHIWCNGNRNTRGLATQMTGVNTVSVNNMKTECVTLVTHLFSAYSLNVTFSLISICKLKSQSIIMMYFGKYNLPSITTINTIISAEILYVTSLV